MKKFNQALNKDITELKTLYIKKDKTEFRQKKAEIIRKHNISKATVYREMAKDVPGSYRQPKYRNRAPEVTAKEKDLVRSLLYKKMSIETVCSEMERLKSQNYTWKRINRIRKEIEKDDLAAKENANKPGIVITVGETTGEITPLKNESAWGEDLKYLLERLLNADKISNDSYITVIVKGRAFKATEEVRKDILNKLANAADANGKSIMDSIDTDSKHLLKEQLRSMKNGLKFGVRDLFDIRKMYKEMGVRCAGIVDFDVLNDTVEFQRQLDALGLSPEDAANAVASQVAIAKAVAELPFDEKIENVRRQTSDLLQSINGVLNTEFLSPSEKLSAENKLLRQIERVGRELPESTKAWKAFKQRGRAALSSECQTLFDELWKICAKYGLFITPSGELESMLIDYGVPVTADKRAWITQALQMLPGLEVKESKNPWKFIKAVHEHLTEVPLR